jgi:hypothetical protein
MVGNHKDKTCFSSALFPEPEPDRTPVEVLAQESYQYLLLKFRQAILRFFENIDQYKPVLETLLTLNFRLTKSQSNSF